MGPGPKQGAEGKSDALGGEDADTRAEIRTRRAARKRMRSADAKLLKMGRRLVVVDAENLVAGAVKSAAEVQWIRQILEEHAALLPEEQVVVGTCHVGLLEVGINWSTARRVVRSGPSGADRALIEVLRQEQIADRFAEVVLVSGDGAFADAVAELATQGVPTTVVAQRARLSAKLRLSARAVVEVPSPPMVDAGRQAFPTVRVISPITDAITKSAN